MNPVRIRNGTATVCAEAPHVTKVSHWEIVLRRLCGKLMMRKSGDLLRCVKVYLLSSYGEMGGFVAENGSGSYVRTAAFFFAGICISPLYHYI